MQSDKSKIIITGEDHDLLARCITAFRKVRCTHGKTISVFWERLVNATIIDEVRFPRNVARLYSTVIVKNLQTNLVTAYTIVLPWDVDKRDTKVSVFSPIGTVLIGLKKGLCFSWDRLARIKNFLVLDVYNSPSMERRRKEDQLRFLIHESRGSNIRKFLECVTE